MGRSCASVIIVAGLAGASTWNCSLLSDVDQLEKVQCIDACDASLSDSDSDSDGASDTDTGHTSSAYRAAVLADTPVGYWRLGDPAGSTSCHDETGNGHDGVVVGGVILGVAGAIKNDPTTAAQFDGTTGSISVGTSFTFTGDAPFSWEIWVNPVVLNGNFCPFFSSMTYDANDNPLDGTYMVSYAAGGDTFGFERYKGTNNAVIALDTPGLQASTWTYIVATSDALGNGVVYINGTAVMTDTNVGAVPTYIAPTILGMRYAGELDEVAIYDYALSAQAVMNHWNAATQ